MSKIATTGNPADFITAMNSQFHSHWKAGAATSCGAVDPSPAQTSTDLVLNEQNTKISAIRHAQAALGRSSPLARLTAYSGWPFRVALWVRGECPSPLGAACREAGRRGGACAQKGADLIAFDQQAIHMMAPSPDWFTGIKAVDMCVNGYWATTKTVTAVPYDAGVDGGVHFRTANVPQDLDTNKIAKVACDGNGGPFCNQDNTGVDPVVKFVIVTSELMVA